MLRALTEGGGLVDYWPWGLLALSAIIFGGVYILAVPLGLLDIASLAYFAGAASKDRAEPDDPDAGS